MSPSHLPEPPDRRPAGRLDSWKEIAAYMGRGVTTVQRWEQEERLPIHRLPHAKRGSVFAQTSELDEWRRERAASMAARPSTDEEEKPAPASGVQPATVAPTRSPRSRPPVAASVLAAVAVLGSVGAWLGSRSVRDARAEAPRSASSAATSFMAPVAVASTPDAERGPALSPDGTKIAIAWDWRAEPGIYVKSLPDGPPRLIWPYKVPAQSVYVLKWSPSGEWIAFNSREGEDTYGLYIVRPSGEVATRLTTMAGVGICWPPDSQSVTFVDRSSQGEPFSLYSISIDTRERLRLTVPPAGSFGDTACSWSPDRSRLAVTRFPTRSEADVVIVRPSDSMSSPQPLTSGTGGLWDLEWTSAGDAIVVSASTGGLQRVDAAGGSPPTTIVASRPGEATRRVSLSRSGPSSRLAYEALRGNWYGTWIWRTAAPDSVTRWSSDAGLESAAAVFSPDGTQVAFEHAREVWLADVSGSRRRQLTFHVPGDSDRLVRTPRWSPDGERLAFSVPVGAQRDIYTIAADGSRSFRLTSEPSVEDNPSWSRDGQWIYFRSDRTGLSQIWKAPAAGGLAVQVTEGEGSQALEAADGTTVYFVRATGQPGLWAVRALRGREHLVAPQVRQSLWDLVGDDVVFVDAPGSNAAALRSLSLSTGIIRSLGPLPGGVREGLSVAADGSAVLLTREQPRSSDIMLLMPVAVR